MVHASDEEVVVELAAVQAVLVMAETVDVMEVSEMEAENVAEEQIEMAAAFVSVELSVVAAAVDFSAVAVRNAGVDAENVMMSAVAV